MYSSEISCIILLSRITYVYNMTLLDAFINIFPLLQYVAAVFTIAGYYFIGSCDANKRANGFKLGLFGNILWIIFAILGNFPIIWIIVITNAALFIGSLRGIWNNIDSIDPDLYYYMIKNKLLMK
jgi:hypothetical protein